MNVYKAYWHGQIVEVEAPSSMAAQEAACAQFKAANPRRSVKRWDIVVVLAAKADGSAVPVDPAGL